MSVGYSGTPLAKKLGIKPGSQVLLAGAPPGYLGLLEPLPAEVTFASRLSRATQLVHLFVTSKATLRKTLKSYRAALPPAGVVWVSWPKKASRVQTDITEDVIRELALPLGFVDNKVCAVDPTWSGLRLVIRKELR